MKKDQPEKKRISTKDKSSRSTTSKHSKGKAGDANQSAQENKAGSTGKKRPFWEAVAKKNPPEIKQAENKPAENERRPVARPAKPRPTPHPPPPKPEKAPDPNEPMRLNKFIAHCGICARRQAAAFVKEGLVTVNGEVEPNPSYIVLPTDVVTFKGEPIKIEEKKVYLLMNKPKDVITTASDEKGRKTVLDLIGNQVTERIFPVGRLDRMTTGLLLLTNDGELTKKLSHPSHKVQKVYHVTLDKILNRPDFERILRGVELEDGTAHVDSLHYVGERKNEVEIGLHSGKNRIVRRIFEHLGYSIEKLDRTYFAGLTKKDIGRGHFRHLTPKEVIMLKHFK